MKIKKIGITDLEKLIEISKTTFWQTFASSNKEENMNEYMKEGFSREKLSSELNNKDSEFYFAEINYETVGYIKINFSGAQTEFQDEEALEIERIYVLDNFKGRKVGQNMLDKAMDIAMNGQKKYVFLGVWEYNYNAIKFYNKNGFKTFGKHIFRLGDEDQTDILMKKEILRSF